MKRFTLLFTLLLISIAGFAQPVSQNNFNVGDTIPDFTVTTTDGEEVTLYDLTSQGKYVYLDFFYTNCGPCAYYLNVWNQFYDTYGCNQGNLFMLSINRGEDDDAAVIAFKEEYGGDYNYAPAVSGEGGGGAVADVWGIQGYPEVVLIGPDNKLILPWILFQEYSYFVDSIPDAANAEPMACTLSVENTEFESFSLYPNPSVHGVTNIQLPGNLNNAGISVYNITGAVVYKAENVNGTVQLPLQVAPGSYFVNVTSNNYSETKTLLVH